MADPIAAELAMLAFQNHTATCPGCRQGSKSAVGFMRYEKLCPQGDALLGEWLVEVEAETE